jgi:hypothetical protein
MAWRCRKATELTECGKFAAASPPSLPRRTPRHQSSSNVLLLHIFKQTSSESLILPQNVPTECKSQAIGLTSTESKRDPVSENDVIKFRKFDSSVLHIVSNLFRPSPPSCHDVLCDTQPRLQSWKKSAVQVLYRTHRRRTQVLEIEHSSSVLALAERWALIFAAIIGLLRFATTSSAEAASRVVVQ